MMIASQLKLIISEAFDLGSADPSDAAAFEKQSLLTYLFVNGVALKDIAHRALWYLLKQTYGNDEELVKSNLTRLRRLCNLFIELYGDGPVMLMRVPARINILGEHIDYVSYIPTASLPFGSREHDMVMLYRSSDAQRVRGASTFKQYAPFSFALNEGRPEASAGNLERAWLGYIHGQAVPPPTLGELY